MLLKSCILIRFPFLFCRKQRRSTPQHSLACIAFWSPLPVKRFFATWQEIGRKKGISDANERCRYAYVEFTEPSLVAQALVMNESVFRGRNIKVSFLYGLTLPNPRISAN